MHQCEFQITYVMIHDKNKYVNLYLANTVIPGTNLA